MKGLLYLLTKGEIYAIINFLKEVRDGSPTEDLVDDSIELLDMLDVIIVSNEDRG